MDIEYICEVLSYVLSQQEDMDVIVTPERKEGAA